MDFLPPLPLLLHGEAGGWDELIIAVVALGILWGAVKLAGRKPVEDEAPPKEEETEQPDQTRPPATPRP
jgi:hypothetical protein